MSSDGVVKLSVLADDKDFANSFSKLGAAAKSALAGVTAVTGAATAAIGGLTKASVDAFASYEQLTGGVETLFKESGDLVMQYANMAYQTAGLSANQYMETVTSFSASLLQGLGGDTEAAAKMADLAITDMSDNANKMGTDMASIQNAYQGFAKQNYTMLDNLKLGYGGTQAEMARLINDSGVLGDTIEVTANTVNDVSFDKIIEAIHVVQTNMGITGTTAEEAATTIEGSVNSMKAAWENLITGLGDENANLDGLVGNFVKSFETAVENLIPRIEGILSGIGDAVVRLAPIIAEELPKMMESLLPPLIDATGTLIAGLASALPELLAVVSDAVQQAVDSIGESLAEKIPFLSGLFENLNTVIKAVAVAFVTLKTATLAYQVASSIAKVIETLTAATNAQTVAQAALTAVMNANPFVLIATVIATVISAVVSLALASEDFRAVMVDVFNAVGSAIQAVIETIKSAINWFKELFGVSDKVGASSGGAAGGGGRGGRSTSMARSAPAAESEPAAFSLSAEDSGRASMLRSLESAIPAAADRVSIATAAMTPAAAYSAPPPVSAGGNSGNGQPTPIIVKPNLTLHFDGDLASLARILKPKLDAENIRLGSGV